jgi:hypothetical protein
MTAQEFLLKKGITKVYQQRKFINLTIGEIIEMLNEYSFMQNSSIQKVLEMNEVATSELELKFK